MERKEIFEKLTTIFHDVMNDDSIVLTEGTTADDIEEWDSLTNVQLVEIIETTFSIKFSAYEISSWLDVGEMVDSIEKKLG